MLRNSCADSLFHRIGRKSSLWKDTPSIVSDWNIYGWKIDYCLAQQTANGSKSCAVKYSFPILIGKTHAMLCLDYVADERRQWCAAQAYAS
jgi:hypothetical protein